MSLDPMEESDPRRVAEQESVMALVRGGVRPTNPTDWQLAKMAERDAMIAKAQAGAAKLLAQRERNPVEDVIAESINNESAAVVEYELLTRHPAGWEMPATDAERRAMLIEVITEERRAKRVTVTPPE